MNLHDATVAQQIAEAVNSFQTQGTGRTPKSVTVILQEDTLVITLPEALTPAEKTLARNAEGVAQVQQFHRRLFASSSDSPRQEIKRITGRQVQEATAEVEPTTGTMVQVFLLAPNTPESIRGSR